MTMVGDVFSSYLTATGTAVSFSTRVKGFFITGTGTATFRDGGASGTVRLTVNSSTSFSGVIPANGIRFIRDVHVTLAGITALTVVYG